MPLLQWPFQMQPSSKAKQIKAKQSEAKWSKANKAKRSKEKRSKAKQSKAMRYNAMQSEASTALIWNTSSSKKRRPDLSVTPWKMPLRPRLQNAQDAPPIVAWGTHWVFRCLCYALRVIHIPYPAAGAVPLVNEQKMISLLHCCSLHAYHTRANIVDTATVQIVVGTVACQLCRHNERPKIRFLAEHPGESWKTASHSTLIKSNQNKKILLPM